MAIPTEEQKRVAAALAAEYGEPDRMMIEQTEKRGDFGVMYLAWFKQVRILFIKPDGKRKLFEGIQKTPDRLV
jgi:hypothetical protein